MLTNRKDAGPWEVVQGGTPWALSGHKDGLTSHVPVKEYFVTMGLGILFTILLG